MIAVRPAVPGDVEAMSSVMTASIRELCREDHRGNQVIVAAWTRNKTPEGIARMLANPESTLLVAERDGEIAAVGAISRAGEITLNYVTPAHRFRGVSRALLADMERRLRQAGHAVGSLTSTLTAHRFYLDAGWEDVGPMDTSGSTPGYPMQKPL